jgi:hypothetical protein
MGNKRNGIEKRSKLVIKTKSGRTLMKASTFALTIVCLVGAIVGASVISYFAKVTITGGTSEALLYIDGSASETRAIADIISNVTGGNDYNISHVFMLNPNSHTAQDFNIAWTGLTEGITIEVYRNGLQVGNESGAIISLIPGTDTPVWCIVTFDKYFTSGQTVELTATIT